MSNTEYAKVYHGNFILVTRVTEELQHVGIIPIIKDEGESQRLAGFGSMNQGFQEVYVNNDEVDKAVAIVERVKAEMEATS